MSSINKIKFILERSVFLILDHLIRILKADNRQSRLISMKKRQLSTMFLTLKDQTSSNSNQRLQLTSQMSLFLFFLLPMRTKIEPMSKTREENPLERLIRWMNLQ